MEPVARVARGDLQLSLLRDTLIYNTVYLFSKIFSCCSWVYRCGPQLQDYFFCGPRGQKGWTALL